jgi:hypothetical protein
MIKYRKFSDLRQYQTVKAERLGYLLSFRRVKINPLFTYGLENAAVEQCPKGICLELLVLPAAERRGNQEFAAQLPRSPRSEAEGGTSRLSGGATAPSATTGC